jgi:two-component system, LytTR family, response regulator
MESIQTQEKGKIFLIPSRKLIRIINQKEIMYVRAESNYSVFVMDDKSEWTLCHTLDYVEKSINQTAFFRCHKSFLVNLIKIKEISRRKPELIMTNNLRLPISRRKRKEFIKSLYRIEGYTEETSEHAVYSGNNAIN